MVPSKIQNFHLCPVIHLLAFSTMVLHGLSAGTNIWSSGDSTFRKAGKLPMGTHKFTLKLDHQESMLFHIFSANYMGPELGALLNLCSGNSK